MKEGWWADPEWQNGVRNKLRSCGAQTGISCFARIHKPDMIQIGRGCRIDDFVYFNGGAKSVVGDRVHIACHVSIVGGGELEIGSCAGLAAGVRIVTGSEDIHGYSLTNPCIPKEFWHSKRGKITIGEHALVFTNSVVLPDVQIGEGTIVGAGCVVRRDLLPWRVYAGERCIPVGVRDPLPIKKLEGEMRAKYGY